MSLVESELGRELGRATDIEIMERLVELDGLEVVDVGCGNGAVSAQLAARGRADSSPCSLGHSIGVGLVFGGEVGRG